MQVSMYRDRPFVRNIYDLYTDSGVAEAYYHLYVERSADIVDAEMDVPRGLDSPTVGGETGAGTSRIQHLPVVVLSRVAK